MLNCGTLRCVEMVQPDFDKALYEISGKSSAANHPRLTSIQSATRLKKIFLGFQIQN